MHPLPRTRLLIPRLWWATCPRTTQYLLPAAAHLHLLRSNKNLELLKPGAVLEPGAVFLEAVFLGTVFMGAVFMGAVVQPLWRRLHTG